MIMLKHVITFLSVVAIAGLCVSSADAALVLSPDARQPGSSPTTQWEDLSGVNSPFTPNSSSASVNPGGAPSIQNVLGVGDVYDFNGSPDFFASTVADESNFDFDSDAGSGAGKLVSPTG